MNRLVTFCLGAISGSLCTCSNFVPNGTPAVVMSGAGVALAIVTVLASLP